MQKVLRAAYFPDSFLEVDGVAMTSNKLVGFARKRDFPFLVVHAGPKTQVVQEDSVRFVSLKRSALAIPMDHSLSYDPFFQRHVGLVRKELERFRPDVIHITGLNDVSIIGAFLAWQMDIPLVGSWHTNLHEFAARRLERALSFAPKGVVKGISGVIEKSILKGAVLYYQMPQCLLAPNQEIMDTLVGATGRKGKLMTRGVDTSIFSPERRTVSDDIIRFGFVGRLRAEKNVRKLAELESRLLETGREGFKFLIVGEGAEREYLEKTMKTAEFTGFLEGDALSEAYANMDIFIFPSETDAYGNVPQEAMASAVPAIVTDRGGPRFFVENGVNGFVAGSMDDFVRYSTQLIDDPELLARMKRTSLEFARTRSWESVFTTVYDAYAVAKEHLDEIKRSRPGGRRRSIFRRFGYRPTSRNGNAK